MELDCSGPESGRHNVDGAHRGPAGLQLAGVDGGHLRLDGPGGGQVYHDLRGVDVLQPLVLPEQLQRHGQ